MRNFNEITIGGFNLGKSHPPVFWPDIDVYFRRDEKKALLLIDAIAQAGGKFLKAAVLHRADIARLGKTTQYFNHVTSKMQTRDYRAIMEEMVVPLPQLSRLLRHARNLGLEIVLSVYDQEGIDYAVAENACAIKIPSSNITHKTLISVATQTQLPIVIDTGRSYWAEIERAINWISEFNAKDRLLLQHSPPGPPGKPEDFHMRMLQGLADSFDVPVGLSDHGQNLEMVSIAIALGACVIEKGLVLTCEEPGIDRAHALPVSKLPLALQVVKEAYLALGETVRPETAVPANPDDRMACIAAKPLKAGHVITASDITYGFPKDGVGAEDSEFLLGLEVENDMDKGDVFSSDLISDEQENATTG